VASSQFGCIARFFLTFIALWVLIGSAAAQTEVHIMVSGPWAYVADPAPAVTPTPRVVVVAPYLPDHFQAMIFSGGDTFNFPGHSQHQKDKGKYYVNIDNLTPNACGTPPPDARPAVTYPLPVPDPTIIQNLVKGPGPRYAFSLPIPCYYESYVDAHAKIDKNPIGSHMKDNDYAIWTILHYSVSSVGQAHLTGTPDGSPTPVDLPLQFVQTEPDLSPAISIVMGAKSPFDTDLPCDSASVVSVKAEAHLFQQDLHAQFPELVGTGGMAIQSYHYIDSCKDAIKRLLKAADATRARNDIDRVEAYLRDQNPDRKNDTRAAVRNIIEILQTIGPLPPQVRTELANTGLLDDAEISGNQKLRPGPGATLGAHTLTLTRAYVGAFTPGAGDCRAAQLNVNGAVH
jgi:hypothetical protein